MKNGTHRIGPESASFWKWLRPETFRAALALMGLGLAVSLLVQKGLTVDRLLGGGLLIALLLTIFYRDIHRYKPRFLKKARMMYLLGFLLLATVAVSRASEYLLTGLVGGLGIDAGPVVVYGVPVSAGAMLVMLLFDFHTAIVFSFIVSLIMGLWQGDPTFTMYVFVCSLTAAFCVVRCRRRTDILRAGVLMFGASLVALAVVLLFKGLLFTQYSVTAVALASFAALSVVAIVSLSLPLLESLFSVTTDISLLELLDLEHPLMKGLMIAAPGTYHHSIIVGNLVEACAETVGVNPMLARVGAYYHDIGKARMPEYFIENLSSGASKHDRLTPHMSSMVLISHVKEGVDMARAYHLPEDVIDIIRQHHGSALIKYFYEKARDASDGEEPSEDVYRYPGPKPQTRAAALVMMADAVEAASRVLSDPTPARIAALVDRIVNHIFLAGQLEECELTFKDIHEIKARFTYILTGVLHKRIDYPGFDFRKGAGGGDSASGDKQPSAEGRPGPQADTAGVHGSSLHAPYGRG